MMKKESYLEPLAEIISLEAMHETLQSGSFNAGGSNLGDPFIPEGDWTDWFSNGLGGII